MKKLYIVDATGLVYRFFYALPGLITSYGLQANVIYGFAKLLIDFEKKYEDNDVIFVFDAKGPTFRNNLDKEYKKNRPKTPERLHVQVPHVVELVRSFGYKTYQISGFEADDIIGTLVEKFKYDYDKIYILTSDKDLMQLVNEKVHLLRLTKGVTNYKEYSPSEVKKEYKVLPEQISEFLAMVGDSIDNIKGLPGIGKVTAAKLLNEYGKIENIYNNLDKLSEKQAKTFIENREHLLQNLKLTQLKYDPDINFDNIKRMKVDYNKIIEKFKEYEFTSLLKELDYYSPLEFEDKKVKNIADNDIDFEVCSVSLYPEMAPDSFLMYDGKKYLRIKFEHIGDKFKNLQKYVYDLKTMLKRIEIENVVDDVMLSAYLLNPNKKSHTLKEIALQHLGYLLEEENKNNKKSVLFYEISSEEEKIEKLKLMVVFELHKILEKKIKDSKMEYLLTKIEIPLSLVLAKMELYGINIDIHYLNKMGNDIAKRLSKLEKDIQDLAGTKFNINSPKQLSEVLSKNLGLKLKKTTKTGFSTNNSVLESLYNEHPIIPMIMEYRKIFKIKSTYIDSLIKISRNGKLYTSFHQIGTSTGRLSSSEPNLQNLPIRDDFGKMIRAAFIPNEGCYILSSDYSQIELRIMAHLSEDENMISMFNHGDDIHALTASKLFGIEIGKVNGEQRRRAKTINFGIIYGMGSFRLAKELSISLKEAQTFIDNYFKVFPGIKKYIENTEKFVEEHGYVKTIFNRRRPIPDIWNSNKNIRAEALRAAINAPVQGSAADIIKISMIQLYNALRRNKMRSRIILQIHDELILNVYPKELNQIINLVKYTMEGVYKLKVPLKVDIGYGKNLLEAK